MPIAIVSPDGITVACAACGALRVLAASKLALGTDANPNAIALPACSCGAVEHLVRTRDETPEAWLGTAFAAQRQAVNALAEYLSSGASDFPTGPVALPPGMPAVVESREEE